MNQYQSNKPSGKIGWGAVLIVIGTMLILGNLGIVPRFGRLIGIFWPMIIIFGALMFHVGYYSNRKNVGLLVPGGILLTVGVVCQSAMLWDIWDFMWPGFILAPAVGLFELYLFGKQSKGLLIPVGILTGLSLIFFSMSFNTLGVTARYIIPAMLIFLGVVVLTKDKRRQNVDYDYQDPNAYQNQNNQQNYYNDNNNNNF
ncbi:MAG: hypothetical protein KBA53_00740 [Thermoclostridium sp.]|nr:hypothetical protein [Thermoclostridium sp.]